MPLSIEDTSPYVSITILVCDSMTPEELRAGLSSVIDNLTEKDADKPAFESRIIDGDLPEPLTVRETVFSIITYKEERRPSWYSIGDLIDTTNHHILISQHQQYVALAFTDNALRDRVVSSVIRSQSAPFTNARLVPPDEMRTAFIGDQLKTLWLSGTHRRTAIKADSKILSGIELEAALNPLEDQSYYYSSVRSHSPITSQNGGELGSVIGCNPQKSRVWLGPTKSWDNFAEAVEAILQLAIAARGRQPAKPIPVLAQPISGVPSAQTPYGISVIVPELLFSDYVTPGDDAWINEFQDAARFAVVPIARQPGQSAAGLRAKVFWGTDYYGDIKYEFTEKTSGDVALKTTIQDWNQQKYKADDILKLCCDPDFLTIYFDDGYTFARGAFYKTNFRDAQFGDWEWVDLSGFNIKAEKPLGGPNGKTLDVPGMGAVNDKSLFGYTVKHWLNGLGGGSPRGWLACDDGSMESADFIHFDPQAGRHGELSLIHVKGSKSDNARREVSVTDYEVVVGQAVKNIRYLDRGNIIEKLAQGAGNNIASAVWENGTRRADRTGMIDALRSSGSAFKKKVYVFQPRVCRSSYEKLRNANTQSNKVLRLKQLDALLLSAKADCNGLGADFCVVADSR